LKAFNHIVQQLQRIALRFQDLCKEGQISSLNEWAIAKYGPLAESQQYQLEADTIFVMEYSPQSGSGYGGYLPTHISYQKPDILEADQFIFDDALSYNEWLTLKQQREKLLNNLHPSADFGILR